MPDNITGHVEDMVQAQHRGQDGKRFVNNVELKEWGLSELAATRHQKR